MIEIIETITTDGPDGQPWPPADRNLLWVIVSRADGRTLWRAIYLAQSPIRCHGLFAMQMGSNPGGLL
jgi:hypothetical protein